MKEFLRILAVILLLIAPAYGQMVSPPANPAAENPESNSTPVATQTQPPQSGELKEADLQFPALRTLGGLGLVICLMVAGYFAAKKFAPRYFSKGTAEKNLKVIETLSMGDKRSISMIEVGNSRFLVGNTANQINLLVALPDHVSLVSEPEMELAIPKAATAKESSVPFRNLFEVEKKRPTQHAGHPLPEDIRLKMRQLREALER